MGRGDGVEHEAGEVGLDIRARGTSLPCRSGNADLTFEELFVVDFEELSRKLSARGRKLSFRTGTGLPPEPLPDASAAVKQNRAWPGPEGRSLFRTLQFGHAVPRSAYLGA